MQGTENRQARAAKLWADLGDASRCPICGGAFALRGMALVCPSGHAYDLSAAGTVHLLRGRGISPVYTRELFLARRSIIDAGLFHGIVEACAGELARVGAPPGLLVDAGCGDGLLGFALARALGMTYAGVDASAEAIRVAGRDVGGAGLLIVGDLARLPFQDGAASVVLNLLSPARYAEFRRVLAADGLLCKVIRGPRHLRELRAEAWVEAREGAMEAERVDVERRADDAAGGRSAGGRNASGCSAGEHGERERNVADRSARAFGSGMEEHIQRRGEPSGDVGADERDALRLFRESCEVLSLREVEYTFPVAAALWEDLVAMTPMTTHYRGRILSSGRAEADVRVTIQATIGVGRVS